MAALGGFASMRIRPLRCRASLGIHVDLSNFNLPRTEVVDLVEGSKPGSTHNLAIRGLPFGLAWNGCGILPGRKQSRCAASAAELVLGNRRDGARLNPALGRRPGSPGTTTAAARLGGDAGSDFSTSLRYFSNRGLVLAEFRS
jgi:hypothetical protein